MIAPHSDYFYKVDYKRQTGTIYSVSFYWTLQPPFNFKYLLNKPSIYLNQISIVPIYLKEDSLSFKIEQLKKRFCTSPLDSPLKHKEIVQLKTL